MTYEQARDEAAKEYSDDYYKEKSMIDWRHIEKKISNLEYLAFLEGADWSRNRHACPYCKNTGKHLCPDVATPIIANCSRKGCPYGETAELKAKLAIAVKEIEDVRDYLVNACDDMAHCNTVKYVPIVDEVNAAGNAARQATLALAKLKDSDEHLPPTTK
jgi:hypothetical protein